MLEVPTTRMDLPVWSVQSTRLITYAYLPQLAQSEDSPTYLCIQQIFPSLGSVFAKFRLDIRE